MSTGQKDKGREQTSEKRHKNIHYKSCIHN